MTTPPAAEPTGSDDRPRGRGRIESLLVERGVVGREAMAAAKARQRGAKRPLVDVLIEQRAVDEEQLVAVLAEAVGMAVERDDALQAEPEAQNLIDADVVQRLGVLPLRVEGDVLVVATGDPFLVPTFDEISQRTGLRVEPRLYRPSAVRAAIRAMRGGEEALHEILKHAAEPTELDVFPATDVEGGAAGIDVTGLADERSPTIRFVNLVLADAIAQGASDVHVEAERNTTRIRFRIDGDLRDVLRVPSSLHSALVARLKIMARLDIIETRRPQDGRIKILLARRQYDLRVSALPAYFGEKVVIRVLDPDARSFDLAQSGLEPDVLERWRGLIRRPHGLLLLTGPTGSGKTSTLYGSVLEIRDPALNIVTIEDPVEYQFPGIVQVPVRAELGVGFARALRSILRQDPDVVLLGEIRDAETAQVAVQTALTGHLVLSTLHTNDAVGAVARLVDLGVERPLLASTLLGVLSQRLVKTICPDCAVPVTEPPVPQLQRLGWDGAEATHALREGRGCRRCGGRGRRGRTAVAELVSVTPVFARLVTESASTESLREQARRDGTTSLLEAGRRKVLRGECAADDVLRVVAGDAPQADAACAATASPPRTSDAAPEGATDAPSCGHCGSAVVAEWRFCAACGAEVVRDGATALVCDDDATWRRLAAATLRADFARVLEAGDGATALDLVAAERPDLLVIDHEMPGLKGTEVIRVLRAQVETATLPVIMLTASSAAELEESSLDAGADDYLRKGTPPQRLRARARALVAARRRWARDCQEQRRAEVS